MPITQRKGKWFWGGQGPFDSKEKAEEVAQAAYAAGYQKLEKIETGAPMDGSKRKLTVTELQEQERKIRKHYLLDESEHSTQSPRGKAKPPSAPVAHSHSHSHHLHKEDGGGEGLGGTVFTSSNAGIFNPTFGERAKPKKKKTGVERLNDFITDGSPIKLDKQEWSATGGAGKTGPLRIDWTKRKLDEEDVQKVVEREGEQNQDSVAKDAKDKQKTMERIVDDIKDDEKEKDLQLEWGWGTAGNQGDSLHRASDKDKLSRNPLDEEEEEEESTIPEEHDLKKHLTYGKMMYKSEGWDKLFKSLIDEMP